MCSQYSGGWLKFKVVLNNKIRIFCVYYSGCVIVLYNKGTKKSSDYTWALHSPVYFYELLLLGWEMTNELMNILTRPESIPVGYIPSASQPYLIWWQSLGVSIGRGRYTWPPYIYPLIPTPVYLLWIPILWGTYPPEGSGTSETYPPGKDLLQLRWREVKIFWKFVISSLLLQNYLSLKWV